MFSAAVKPGGDTLQLKSDRFKLRCFLASDDFHRLCQFCCRYGATLSPAFQAAASLKLDDGVRASGYRFPQPVIPES